MSGSWHQPIVISLGFNLGPAGLQKHCIAASETTSSLLCEACRVSLCPVTTQTERQTISEYSIPVRRHRR